MRHLATTARQTLSRHRAFPLRIRPAPPGQTPVLHQHHHHHHHHHHQIQQQQRQQQKRYYTDPTPRQTEIPETPKEQQQPPSEQPDISQTTIDDDHDAKDAATQHDEKVAAAKEDVEDEEEASRNIDQKPTTITEFEKLENLFTTTTTTTTTANKNQTTPTAAPAATPAPATETADNAEDDATPSPDHDDGGADDDQTSLYTEQISKILRQPRQTPPYEGARSYLRRIGQCLAFGCDAAQTAEAARLVRIITADFARLQMARANNAVDPNAVLEHRIDVSKEDPYTEPQSDKWGAIPRMFPSTHIVEKAIMRYMDHVVATASSASRKKWQTFQKHQRKSWLVGIHGKRAAPPPFVLRTLRFPTMVRLHHMRATQKITVYTRLAGYTEMDDRVKFVLKSVVWSQRFLSPLAEAHSSLVCKPLPNTMAWFLSEMARMSDLEWAEAKQQLDGLLADIVRLEKDTWDRPDAAEDFGGARWAEAASPT